MRQLSTKWSIELENDLKSLPSVGVDQTIVDEVTRQLQMEIDRDILERIVDTETIRRLRERGEYKATAIKDIDPDLGFGELLDVL